MVENERKTELIAELAEARSQITGNFHGLKRDLDFASKARRAFKTNPAVWIGAAVVIGLVVARLPFGRKKVAPAPSWKRSESKVEKAEKAGLLLGALKIAFDIAKPTLMGWATRRVANYFESSSRDPGHRR